MTKSETTLWPRRERAKEIDPAHIVKLLQNMAKEYPRKSGRHELLMDACAVIKTIRPNGVLL